MNQSLKAHLALLTATLLFAINYWVSKELVGSMSVFQLVFFRTIGAAILFGICYLIVPLDKVSWRDKLYIALAAAFGVALNQLLFFGGLQYTTPIDTATIHVSNPIIVMFLASLFLKTKLSRNKIFGLILGATGALVLVLYQKELGVGPNATKGNLMVLGNTAAYAVFLVMMKPMLKKYNPLTATFWVYIFASIIIFPIGLQSMTQVEWPELLSNHGFSLFYIIVLVTFGAYFLSVYSLQHLSPTAVSFYIYLQPVFAFIIAVAIGDQLPSVIKIAAAMLIFTGVYFVNQAPKRAHNKMD